MDNGLRLAKFNTENGFKFFDLARHLYRHCAKADNATLRCMFQLDLLRYIRAAEAFKF